MPRILNQTPDKSVRGSVLLAAPSRTLPELILEQFAYLVSLNQLPKEQLSFSSSSLPFYKTQIFRQLSRQKNFCLARLIFGMT